MTLSNLKIVRVMCRSDLYASGSKFLVYISICDHRYFAFVIGSFKVFPTISL